MKVLVIGGTGHIGSYLVPRLVQGGHAVQVVARNPAPQYTDPRLAWGAVEWIVADRAAEERDGTWRARMDALEADAVIDLICYTVEQNRTLVEAFAGRVQHFIHCGTIWSYGPPARTPYAESDPRRPISEYGRQKALIEADLLHRYRTSGFPATIIHPGHISGRKWLPIDPQGTRNGVGVYEKLARGETVHLPGDGLATLHHVHADDLAQLFESALIRRNASLGEAFSGVAPFAMSLLACSHFVAGLFGREPNLCFATDEEMAEVLGSAWATTQDHRAHSPCCSIEKAQRLLGYAPRFTTEQIYVESLEYLLETGQLVL
ncbi:MAG: NAD-dependent epimerase/dehydratase family protein [Armatimonadetes bacterium]|nr:NAD-dependent epimerase/dehydratase family protein [Armatimonadota bacterium]